MGQNGTQFAGSDAAIASVMLNTSHKLGTKLIFGSQSDMKFDRLMNRTSKGNGFFYIVSGAG